MLQALLRGKLGSKDLCEDALTAIIFQRLAYLEEPGLAWKILLSAARRSAGAAPELPWEEALFGWNKEASDRFSPRLWPSLEPGPDHQERTRIEPDVLLKRGDAVIIVEAKAPGKGATHSESQLRREHSATKHREAHEHIGLLLIEPPHDQSWLPNIGAPVRVLRWVDLADVIAVRRITGSQSAAQNCILEDMLAALASVGASPLVPMGMLGQGLVACKQLIGPVLK